MATFIEIGGRKWINIEQITHIVYDTDVMMFTIFLTGAYGNHSIELEGRESDSFLAWLKGQRYTSLAPLLRMVCVDENPA